MEHAPGAPDAQVVDGLGDPKALVLLPERLVCAVPLTHDHGGVLRGARETSRFGEGGTVLADEKKERIG